jgi:hypothetical protein
MTNETLIVLAVVLGIVMAGVAVIAALLVWDWAGERRKQRHRKNRDPVTERRRIDHRLGHYQAEMAQLDRTIAEWERYTDTLEAQAEVLAAELDALRWHAAGLAAEKQAIHRQHHDMINMVAQAVAKHGWTDISDPEAPTVALPVAATSVVDVAEVPAALADVIPITAEHRDTSERAAHRERLDRLRDDRTVPISFIGAPWRELPPAPTTRLSHLAERVA